MNTNENITLVDNNILSEIGIAEKLDAFFSNIAKELNIKVRKDFLCDVSSNIDPVEKLFRSTKTILSYK